MSRLLIDLHPLFQPVAELILGETQAKLGSSTVRPLSTFRTLAEQAAAKAGGASKLSLGFHNFGLAMDIGIITPEGAYITNGADSRYKIYGEIAKAHGCTWGGDWIGFPDPAHCQMDGGLMIGEFIAWMRTHQINLGVS